MAGLLQDEITSASRCFFTAQEVADRLRAIDIPSGSKRSLSLRLFLDLSALGFRVPQLFHRLVVAGRVSQTHLTHAGLAFAHGPRLRWRMSPCRVNCFWEAGTSIIRISMCIDL